MPIAAASDKTPAKTMADGVARRSLDMDAD
jgi:hypothetical protein